MTKDTVNIHGKEYETVASRVARFREEYKQSYSIETELISADDKTVVMKATISKLATTKIKPDMAVGDYLIVPGCVVATGYAEESRTSSSINRTSALENCETSAIGRALAAFGMAGTEYASADEVAQAIHQQSGSPKSKSYSNPAAPASDKQKAFILDKLAQKGVSVEEMNGHLQSEYGVSVPLTKEGAGFVIEELIGVKATVQR